MPSFEVLLPLGAVGFYLLDATALLYGNEVMLEWRRGAWRSSVGLPLQLAGRSPCVPNLLAPHGLLFQVQWDERPHRDHTQVDAGNLGRRLAPVRLFVTLQALLLLFALPVLSIGFGAGLPLLLLFAVFYALTLASLTVLFVRRKALRLSVRQCTWLALEALLCAPFAINLVRKVSLARSRDVRWVELAQAQFPASARRTLLQQVEARIMEAMLVVESSPATCDRLEALRTSLKEQLDAPVVA